MWFDPPPDKEEPDNAARRQAVQDFPAFVLPCEVCGEKKGQEQNEDEELVSEIEEAECETDTKDAAQHNQAWSQGQLDRADDHAENQDGDDYGTDQFTGHITSHPAKEVRFLCLVFLFRESADVEELLQFLKLCVGVVIDRRFFS